MRLYWRYECAHVIVKDAHSGEKRWDGGIVRWERD